MTDASLRGLMARIVVALPSPILQALCGGALEIGGRTFDPQAQILAKASTSGPKMSALPLAKARTLAALGFKFTSGPVEDEVSIEDLLIPTVTGPLMARAYRPAVQDPTAPVFVYLHMGGGVIGDLETGHTFCSILAREARCAVISLAYRLAPEHPFPEGLNDALAGFRWTRAHASRFGAPDGHAAIGGDSMGGNFAAVIAQDLRAEGEPQPALQLLVYPATDLASETQSMSDFKDAFPLDRDTMEWFMRHYLPFGADRRNLRLSPLAAGDLSGLAPAIVVTAGFDPLSDQGEIYAHRLLEAGVPTLYRCYESLPHGFLAFSGLVSAADTACREIAGLVRQGFEGKLEACAALQPMEQHP